MSPCGVGSCAERTSCGRHHCLPSGCLPLWGASTPPCLPCTSNGGCVFWGCARREVPRSDWVAHLWGHEKSGCAVGAVPPSLVPSKVLPYLSGMPLGEQPLPVLHSGCRSCRTGMDLEVVNVLSSTHPTPTHPLTPRTRHATHPGPPHVPHPPPKAPHSRHAPPTPRTRIHRTLRQQRTLRHPPRQPPLTPVTTSPKNHATHPPTGTDQRSTHHSTTPYVMPTSKHHPRHPPRPAPPPEHLTPMYVHNLRNAHTEPLFRTYTRHRNYRSSTPPREHIAPSEHHAPTDNKAPSCLTQNTPHPPEAHPKEATTPTSPIPTQVSQAPPCWTQKDRQRLDPSPKG